MPAGWLKRQVRHAARLLYPMGRVRPILAGPGRGLRFRVAPAMGLAYALAAGKDNLRFRWLAMRIRPGMVVYDVGANCGQATLPIANLVGRQGRVVAFEPAEVPFQSLLFNVQLNALTNVQAFKAAAADRAGEADFEFDRDRPTQGKLAGCEPSYVASAVAGRARVRAVMLDDVLAEAPPPDLLKVDVEGSAGLVFRGAAQLLDQFGPPIYLELHGPEEQNAVTDELLARGYRAESLAGEPVDDPAARWVDPLWCYRR